MKELNNLGVKGTFFLAGVSVMLNPVAAEAIYDAGHQIAAHTWTHHPLTSLTNAQIVAEIKYTEARIFYATGIVVRHMRPPFGNVDDRVRAIISALGYRNIMWTSVPNRDSHDGGQPGNTLQDRNRVLDTISSWFVPQAGFISLQHDITEFTSQIAIESLRKINATANFPLKIKTVAECIGDAPYAAQNPTGSGSGLDGGNGFIMRFKTQPSGSKNQFLPSMISYLSALLLPFFA